MLVLRDVDRLCFQTVRVRQRESRSMQVNVCTCRWPPIGGANTDACNAVVPVVTHRMLFLPLLVTPQVAWTRAVCINPRKMILLQ